MELAKIKEHWQKLANEYGDNIQATTKTPTIKRIEINALINNIHKLFGDKKINILEVGCGNGYNCFGIAEKFPNASITGIDFIPEMISNAQKMQSAYNYTNVKFSTGDILNLAAQKNFDLVFTNRCIINLNSIELQKKALLQLKNVLKPTGYILNIENSKKTYNNQNDCRKAIGLTERTPDEYNLFIDEENYLDYATTNLSLKLIASNDIATLHDLLLYVLIPSTNGNKVDYNHKLVDAATELSISIYNNFGDVLKGFGQNKLYIFKKEE